MREYIVKSSLIIGLIMMILVFAVSNINVVNAAQAETKNIDLTDVSIRYYFYPEGYLEKDANNELKKASNSTKKVIKLSGTEFDITVTSDEQLRYNNHIMREVTYEGEAGYINENTFKYEVADSQEVKTIDLSRQFFGRFYFYPEGFLVETRNNRLRWDPNSIERIERLPREEFEITIIGKKTYRYLFKKMYLVEYEGKRGYINTNMVRFFEVINQTQPTQQQLPQLPQQVPETKSINLEKAQGKYFFYPKDYLEDIGNNELVKRSNPRSNREYLTGNSNLTITIISDQYYNYEGTAMCEVEYNGVEGYINTNVLQFEVQQNNQQSQQTSQNNNQQNNQQGQQISNTTKYIDLSQSQGRYYFYPKGYLIDNGNGELIHSKISNKQRELLKDQFNVTIVSDKIYNFENRAKMYEVIYNGVEGYMNVNVLQFENSSEIFFILLVFHFDISGRDINFLQLENIAVILFKFFVFHLDISGKSDRDSQLENI